MSNAFLFPGQGSQHVGMGHALYKQSSAARAVFDQADTQLGFSLSQICFSGPEERLTDTRNQQPALFVTSYATWLAMQSAGWDAPDFVAGHSLGEFSALAVAGSIGFADGLDLVQQRGQLMHEAGERDPGSMAAILALDIHQVALICEEAMAQTKQPVQVANDNCPGQAVVSGADVAVDRVMQLAEEAGARKVVKLPITIAAHSVRMASAADAFAHVIDNTTIYAPQIPIIGNVSAEPLQTIADIRAELKAQLTASVAWTASMQYLSDHGVTTVVEVGPGDVLRSLMKRIDRKVKRITYEVEVDYEVEAT